MKLVNLTTNDVWVFGNDEFQNSDTLDWEEEWLVKQVFGNNARFLATSNPDNYPVYGIAYETDPSCKCQKHIAKVCIYI